MGAQVCTMSADDLQLALEWAAREGWNPGRGDAGHFMPADPGGFLMVRRDGRMVGSISMVRYGPDYAFCGLYIVAPDRRRSADGVRLALAASSLAEGRVVGTDGVVERADAYARLGFDASHVHRRYSGVVEGRPDPAVVDVREVSADSVVALDDACFPGDRRAFMRAWLLPPHVTRVSLNAHGAPDGLAVARRAESGWRVGPVIAPDADRAEALLRSLGTDLPGEVLHVDINTGNADAVALAEHLGLVGGFECVRMYRGGVPDLPTTRIFAPCTLELG